MCWCFEQCGCEGISPPYVPIGYGCSDCEECVNCDCQLKPGNDCTTSAFCQPCYDCVNCKCTNTCNSNQCCLNYTCVEKCVDNAATCEWDEPPDIYAVCESGDPSDRSCPFGIAGEVCSHRIIYRVGTAKCADCEPNCAKNRVEACAVGYAIRCKNVRIWLHVYCLCQDEDSQPSYFSGDAYECIN